MSSGDAIEAHYDAFPYPKVRRIVRPSSPLHVAGTLNHLLRRRAHDAFGAKPRVWVAGCGTQQGTTWSLAFPEGDVLATDISSETIERAESLAHRLGARARFERNDLEIAPPGEAFDLVVCTGVVHHLRSPLAGLRSIRAALAPAGAASIMVYSRAHRAPLEPMRRAAIAVASGQADPYAIAVRLLDAAIHGRGEPLGRQLLESLWAMRETDRSFVADVLLNPREASYEVGELMSLLDEAGLRFVEWLYPAAWRLAAYVDDLELVALAATLGPMEQASLVQRITGLGGPLLEVLVERDDAPVRPPYTREERLGMRLLCARPATELDLTGGDLQMERPIPTYTMKDGMIGGTSRSGGSAGQPWVVSDAALPIIEAFDGTATVAELAARFADRLDADSMLALADTLGPREVGLLAPVWPSEEG